MAESHSVARATEQQSLPSGFFARLRGWWNGFCARQRLRGEFQTLQQHGQLDSVLQEAGTSRGAMGAILRAHPGAPARLATMLKRLGINRDQLRRTGTLHDVELTCTMCEATGKCEHWLRGGKDTGYEDFCPNATTFQSVRGERKQ